MDPNRFVSATHQVTGERRDVPAHWVGDNSPFPGQWVAEEESPTDEPVTPTEPPAAPPSASTGAGRRSRSSNESEED